MFHSLTMACPVHTSLHASLHTSDARLSEVFRIPEELTVAEESFSLSLFNGNGSHRVILRSLNHGPQIFGINTLEIQGCRRINASRRLHLLLRVS